METTGPRNVEQRKASGSRNDGLWRAVGEGPRGVERVGWTGGRWGVTREELWGEPAEAAGAVPEDEASSGETDRSWSTSELDRFPGKVTITLVKRRCIESEYVGIRFE